MIIQNELYPNLQEFGLYINSNATNIDLHGSIVYESPIKLFEFSNLYGFALIGAYTYINKYFNFNNICIGRYCSLASYIREIDNHDSTFISTHPLFTGDNFAFNNRDSVQFANEMRSNHPCKPKSCIIGNDVWIGENVLIKSGVSIGDGAIVAANSFVNKNIPPYSVYGGSPARLLKMRFNDEIIDKLIKLKWWDYDFFNFSSVFKSHDLNSIIDSLEILISTQAVKKINSRILKFDFINAQPSIALVNENFDSVKQFFTKTYHD